MIIKNIANILTLTRLFACFVIFAIYVSKYIYWAEVCFVLFVFAALSDYFDGYFARKHKAQSNFGVCFDPICDKIFVLAMLILLYNISSCGFFVLFLIVGRELWVSGIREFLAPKNISMPVSKLAKYKTGFQMSAIGILLFYQSGVFQKLLYLNIYSSKFFDCLPILGTLALYIATAITIYTGWLYTRVLIKYL